jgi:hypothetical protein
MAMRKGKNVHVVPRDAGWAIKAENESRATSIHHTQHEAVVAAREIARKYGCELVIHGRDGRIRERESYSSDPLPPKAPRKVLFPTSPVATGKKAIKKAIHEVIQESHSGSESGSTDTSGKQ